MAQHPEGLSREDAVQLQHSLTASNEEIFQILCSPRLDILSALTRNPNFNEEHLLALLKRRDLGEELINSLYLRKRQTLSHRGILAITKNPDCPAPLLRNLLPQLRLFELLDICYLPGVTADQKIAAERVIIHRLPTTPLGNKITLARRGTATLVGELLKDSQTQLAEACLANPRLKEAAVFQYLRSSRASAETISMIARHQRWKMRPNLQLAILKHRNTPHIWYTLWLPKQNLTILKQLSSHFRGQPARKQLIDSELLKRRR
jgi:hypothetical protein